MARGSRAAVLTMALQAALLWCFAAQASQIFSAHAKSGQATLIRRFYDCQRHNPAGDAGAWVEHGSVTVKDVFRAVCGNAQEPVREVWYTSAPGFIGVDKVTFQIGRSFQLVVNVTVQ